MQDEIRFPPVWIKLDTYPVACLVYGVQRVYNPVTRQKVSVAMAHFEGRRDRRIGPRVTDWITMIHLADHVIEGMQLSFPKNDERAYGPKKYRAKKLGASIHPCHDVVAVPNEAGIKEIF